MSSSILDEPEKYYILDSSKELSSLFDEDVLISINLRRKKILNTTYATKFASERISQINKVYHIYRCKYTYILV
jgi:hypothetical protein